MGSEITKRNRKILDALYEELGDNMPAETYDARKDVRYRNLFSIKDVKKGSVLDKLRQNILDTTFASEDMPSEEEIFEFAKMADNFLPEMLEKKYKKRKSDYKTKTLKKSRCKDDDTKYEHTFEYSNCSEDEDVILDHCAATRKLLALKANNYKKFRKKIQKILDGLSESFKEYLRGHSDKFIEDEVVEYIRDIETTNYFMSKPPRMIVVSGDSGECIVVENPEYTKWHKRKDKDINEKERKEYIKKYGTKDFRKKQSRKEKIMKEYRENRKYDNPSLIFCEYGGGDDIKEIPPQLEKDFKKKLSKKEEKLGRSLTYYELSRFKSKYIERFSQKSDKKFDSMVKASKKKKNQGFVDPWLDYTVSNLTSQRDGLKRLIKDIDKGRDKLIDMIEASISPHGMVNHNFTKALEGRVDTLQHSLKKKLKEIKKHEKDRRSIEI